MKRSHLRSKYLNRSESNRLTFSKQRNYCVNLLRKTKRDLWNYENLNEKGIVDNKNFGKTTELLLSNKIKPSEKICLVEGKKSGN